MLMKTRIFLFLLVTGFLMMSCQTTKNTNNKRRRVKKNCDCPSWTYHPNENLKSITNAKV